MIVVSDTSPLSYLDQIGRLPLLPSLYDDIIVPPAVHDELCAASSLHAAFDWSFVRVVRPQSISQVETLLAELDRGESEAIVVALEVGAEFTPPSVQRPCVWLMNYREDVLRFPASVFFRKKPGKSQEHYKFLRHRCGMLASR